MYVDCNIFCLHLLISTKFLNLVYNVDSYLKNTFYRLAESIRYFLAMWLEVFQARPIYCTIAYNSNI